MSLHPTLFARVLLHHVLSFSLRRVELTRASRYRYAGTTSDAFLDENQEWLKSANNWALFNAAASLGVIHQGHTAEALNVLEPYLPKDGGVGADGPHVDGGGLYVILFSFCGRSRLAYLAHQRRHPHCLTALTLLYPRGIGLHWV